MLLELLLSLAPAIASGAAADTGVVYQADHVHVAGNKVFSPGQVLVRDGRIVAVGEKVDGGQAPQVELHGHLSSGLIALGETSLLGEEGTDTTRFLMPEVEARMTFDPSQPALARLAAEGITTVVLTPPSYNLLAGRGLIAKTAGGRILAASGPMHVAFDSGMFNDRPDPTPGADFGGGFFFFGPNGAVNPNGYRSSYPGAADLLEKAVESKDSAAAGLKDGAVRAWLRSDSRAESSRALAFAQRHKVKGTLEAGPRIGDLAPQIKESGLGIAMTLFGERNPHFGVQSALALAKAGVNFGFCLDAGAQHPVRLRLAAALCRRGGMEEGQAFDTLTAGAARAAGLEKQVGSIAAGLDADLVLWSGAPTELTSRVLQVWVDGKSVHQAAAQGAKE
ncbi:MAG: amidohydrolase family protein [Planctomycetota bacterium]